MYELSKKIIEKKLYSELMLYDSERDEIHILNDSSALIYKLHREGKSVGEIETALREAFSIDTRIDLTSDIERCLNDLRRKKMT